MGAPGIDDKSKVTAHKLQSTIVNMNFGGQELGFVIDYLRETTELPIHVKWGALEAAGITSRSAATIGLKKVSADKALEIASSLFRVGSLSECG